MKAVIQRVSSAMLEAEGKLVSEIGKGLVVYFGVGKGDTEKQAQYFAKKIPALRIFEDENGKTNRSIADVGGEVLFVSQLDVYKRQHLVQSARHDDGQAFQQGTELAEYSRTRRAR